MPQRRPSKHPLRVLSYVIAIFGVIIAIVAAMDVSSYQTRLDTVAGQTAKLPRYGIATGSSILGLSSPDLEDYLSGIQASGAGWIRFDFDWNLIQPDGVSQFNWDAYDKVVASAKSHDLKIVGIIDFTPAWARPADCQGQKQCRPADPAAYASFAKTLAVRYAPQGVHCWEIWNEANTQNFFQPTPNVAQYSALLIDSAQKIHEADSQSIIISASTAPAATTNNTISPADFLAGLYKNHAGKAFDAVGAHPYTYPLSPSLSSTQAWSQMSVGPNSLRSIMEKNHDGKKKIWITEFGSPTDGPGPTSTSADPALDLSPTHVDETTAVDELSAGLKLYQSDDWVGPFFYYSYEDAGTTTDTNENFFGLVRTDGSHKPAYDVFSSAAHSK